MGAEIKQKGDDAMNGFKHHRNIIIDLLPQTGHWQYF